MTTTEPNQSDKRSQSAKGRMRDETVTDLATRLIQARRDRAPLADAEGFPGADRLDDAYAIQARGVALRGQPVGGWKAGCTSAAGQAALGLSEPIAGTLTTPRIHHGPTVLPAAVFRLRLLESEYCFRLGREILPRDAPYSDDEILDAVATVHPGIEIVESAFADFKQAGAGALIADNAVHGAFVLGDGVEAWRGLDMTGTPVKLRLNGRVVADGDGSAVLGDPRKAVCWLVRDRLARRLPLKGGMVLATGTCTGLTEAPAGSLAVAEFGSLGRVAVKLAL